MSERKDPPIAAARALIEPLTGYTPKPWEVTIYDEDGFIMVTLSGYFGDFKPNDVRLIAAAPDLLALKRPEASHE